MTRTFGTSPKWVINLFTMLFPTWRCIGVEFCTNCEHVMVMSLFSQDFTQDTEEGQRRCTKKGGLFTAISHSSSHKTSTGSASPGIGVALIPARRSLSHLQSANTHYCRIATHREAFRCKISCVVYDTSVTNCSNKPQRSTGTSECRSAYGPWAVPKVPWAHLICTCLHAETNLSSGRFIAAATSLGACRMGAPAASTWRNVRSRTLFCNLPCVAWAARSNLSTFCI